VLEISDAELPGLLRSGSSLWKSIADEGIPVFGRALKDIGRSS
jgi:hypothetical protein